tara:strand:+ start:440 stop:1105 length:666 start_codon:yes stop_codon:yes gene_type:complete
MTVRVKICGVTDKTQVKMIVDAGADAIGVVVNVPDSPRNIDFKQAIDIFRFVPPFLSKVLVTVPKSVDEIIEIYELIKPDVIQINGLENARLLREIRDNVPCKLIVTVSFEINNPNNNIELIKKNVNKTILYGDAIMLDSKIGHTYGGTGHKIDWDIAKKIIDQINDKHFILAGGLKPENIQKAIRYVNPYAVDVSSGVEKSPGIKNPALVKSFIKLSKEI